MISPLTERNHNGRELKEEDIPLMRHQFMCVYGWLPWDDLDIDEVFTLWPFVQEEIRKKEELRLCTLKYYGVKNPK